MENCKIFYTCNNLIIIYKKIPSFNFDDFLIYVFNKIDILSRLLFIEL